MKIYENQIAALGEARAAEYERRLLDFLRAHVAPGTGREVRASEVQAHIADARAGGLDTEREIAAYTAGVWRFGDDYLARIEPLRPSFTDPTVSPEAKARPLLAAFDALEREKAGP